LWVEFPLWYGCPVYLAKLTIMAAMKNIAFSTYWNACAPLRHLSLVQAALLRHTR